MSWTVNGNNLSLDEARKAVSNAKVPDTIARYILDGLGGLEAKYGADIRVNVNGYGHLCDAAHKDTYDKTTATLTVGKADAREKTPE